MNEINDLLNSPHFEHWLPAFETGLKDGLVVSPPKDAYNRSLTSEPTPPSLVSNKVFHAIRFSYSSAPHCFLSGYL